MRIKLKFYMSCDVCCVGSLMLILFDRSSLENYTSNNTSTTEALAAKIGLYFTLFVIELYIFIISLRNS